jgi:hypothetical protein
MSFKWKEEYSFIFGFTIESIDLHLVAYIYIYFTRTNPHNFEESNTLIYTKNMHLP